MICSSKEVSEIWITYAQMCNYVFYVTYSENQRLEELKQAMYVYFNYIGKNQFTNLLTVTYILYFFKFDYFSLLQ